MRIILAGLFVLIALIAFVGFVSSRYGDNEWPWWATPSIFVITAGSIWLALIVFNQRGYRPIPPWKSPEEYMKELEAKGLLLTESFQARRAFQVEEFEDEGSHYFIELDDGSVLYLSGQYLCDFEAIDDDPELNQPRQFPCTSFTLIRHKEAGFVMDILCSGEVLEPESIAPSFNKDDWRRGIPEDGERITTTTYDEIKAQRLRTK